ncbi:MAG: SDR family oxidoreductase, partial [Hyphomicrobiales bacterium]|nr:SDR family oxidoreductase [Hyphomicrobiales bacterium]
LIPGCGMIAWGKDKSESRVTAEFYNCAVEVMRGAEAIDKYIALPQQEAFDIEYWLLEEAKLERMPKPKPLAGRVALVTGGAGGIGRAVAARLMADGACVALADVDAAALEAAVADFSARFGKDAVAAVRCDVTDEAAVAGAFRDACVAFGGLDILVSNAGIASASPFEDTTLDLWNRNLSLMATGYFLVAREAFRLFKAQKGGNVVFVASKNGLAASPGAAAYCTAKAAEIHLARCLALEGAPLGVRVNTINPDAVLRGSKIWQGEWRAQRAASNKVAEDDLEEVYRQRSLLKLPVFPEDVADAVHYFVSDASAKCTGNILNVDAGNQQSFTR